MRALVVVGGNPCLCTPNADRLREAVQKLDLMVSLDVYLNETSEHADVILPGPSPLASATTTTSRSPSSSVRNMANWSPAAMQTDLLQEWQTLLRLTGIAAGQGPRADLEALDDLVAGADGRSATGSTRRSAPRPARPGAAARPHAAGRSLRPDPRRPRGRTARTRPRPAAAADPRRAAHRQRHDRAGPEPRSPATCRGWPPLLDDGPATERPGAHRPASAELEQLVDAQPRAPGARCQHLHGPRAPRRRARGWACATAATRSCGRAAGAVTRARRGHRHGAAGRREHPARLGPRHRRSPHRRWPPPTPGSTATCSPTTCSWTPSRAPPPSTASPSPSPQPEEPSWTG